MPDKTTTEFPEELEQAIRSQLRQQLANGIAEGVYATCGVVRDLATEAGISAEDRLDNIIRFCETGKSGYEKVHGDLKGS